MPARKPKFASMTFSPKPLARSNQNLGPVSPKFGKAVVKFHDCTEYAGCSQDKAEKISALVRTSPVAVPVRERRMKKDR